MSNLTKQLKFFDDNKESLLKEYGEKFIVISPNLKVDAFNTEYEAYVFGRKEYGLGKFLLKDCQMLSLNQVYIISPTIALA